MSAIIKSTAPGCRYSESDVFGYFLDRTERRESSGMKRHVSACSRCCARLFSFVEAGRAAKGAVVRTNAAAKPQAPRSIGGRTILASLGTGGMGKVWKAFDPVLQRSVALKVMHAELLGDRELRERFMTESRTTARLKHPNIVQIYAVGADRTSVFIAMELVEGQPLSDLIGTPALELQRCLMLFRQILEGIGAAHSQQILHRDIKPSNIMAGPDGRIKILDFGLAKELCGTAVAFATAPGTLIGTLRYMAPEAVVGEPATYATDIYSLGMVFNEMLTGRASYCGARSPAHLLEKMKHTPLRPPSHYNLDVEPWLDEVVLKMCALDRTQRFESVAAVLAALESYAPRKGIELDRAPLGPCTHAGLGSFAKAAFLWIVRRVSGLR